MANSSLSQATRAFRVDTDLGATGLLLEGFSGTETISSPFLFHVDMVSTDADIDTAALLRTPITLTITLEDESERKIGGMISRMVEHGHRDGLTSYRAEMVPKLWFLGLNQDSRIFQNMKAIDIVEEVLRERGITHEIRCNASYPVIEYCVQYRESDLAFVQRLLEQEGIFYFFRHDNGEHVMVIADDKAVFETNPHHSRLRYRADDLEAEEAITSFQRESSVHVGKVTLSDYDPLQPTLDMSASLSGDEEQEVYDYPGGYAKLFCNAAGSVADEAQRYARLRLELQESRRSRSEARGNARGLLVGYTFALEEHHSSSANTEYVITSLSHSAHGGDYRSWDGGAEATYDCTFVAGDPTRPFRPERRTPRPVVEGTQTAVVVGPSGEEIFTDSHGRVKCQFHWDRLGKKDDTSSCWIRVATQWAGKGYGSVSIPRIGNEVVVDFLEGDPDQPLIVGSVYNADQVPPNGLPDAGIQMGMKSRSSKGGGGYNEISMTDTKDTEVITIHGQYDMNTTVEHDETLTVHNCRTQTIDVDESISIGQDQTAAVGRDRSENVGSNETITIGSNRTETVGSNETISIGGNRSENVAKNETITIGGERSETVAKDETVEVGGVRKVTVAKDEVVKIGGLRKTTVGKNDQLNVKKKLVIEAGDEITLKSGKASIVMKKNGDIVIKGKKISVKGSGPVAVKGSKIAQN